MTHKIEINLQTGEVKNVAYSEQEIAQREQDAIKYEADRIIYEAEKQAKIDAKASALAKLTALGLTEEEVKSIL